MTNLNNLFANNSTGAAAASGNALNKTAQLTATATEVANSCFKTITANITERQTAIAANEATGVDDDNHKLLVAEVQKLTAAITDSQKSHDAMDQLIADSHDLSTVDIEFLKTESEDVLEKMLKSQQSKRSRTKSKAMTQDNYLTLITAGVAENLLRMATGKSKSAGGGGKRADVGYTAEQIEKFTNDQEELKKAIRNVQSKKCIMKSKAGFDETSEAWLELLRVEEQLKGLRTTGGTTTVVVKEADPEVAAKAEKALATEELLKDVEDIDKMKAADAKSLLNKIKDMLATR